LPEVKLGILPGAGGTQRLPRVVGVETALQMIVSRRECPRGELRGTRLFDAVIDGEILAGALAFAAKIVAEKRPSTRVRDIEVVCPDASRIFGAAREKAARESPHYPAPHKCIDAVEAAVKMPVRRGPRFRAQGFSSIWCRRPESRALRHVFFAERAAGRIPGVSDTTPTRAIGNDRGHWRRHDGNRHRDERPVRRHPGRAARDEPGRAWTRAARRSAGTTRLPPSAASSRVRAWREHGAVAPDALLRRSARRRSRHRGRVRGDGLKREVFATLDRVAKPGAILATNTSTLDVNRIAAATNRPQDVIGMHFFSPAHVMKLWRWCAARAPATTC
jgi:3-hydroxyacyl-CoA dehydrogenase